MKGMKAGKVLFLVLLTMVSLCVVNSYQVKSQGAEIITIKSDGNVVTSTGEEVPIEKAGNIYTLTDNIINCYMIVECDNIVIDGAGYDLVAQGDIGIDLTNRSDVTVRNMNITLCIYGISLWNATRNTITGY